MIKHRTKQIISFQMPALISYMNERAYVEGIITPPPEAIFTCDFYLEYF